MPARVLPMFGGKVWVLGDQKRFSLYVLEYLSDNYYVIFMSGCKALGVKGLGHEILMKFYQFWGLFFMLIPSLSFLDFVLWEPKLIGANRIVEEARTVWVVAAVTVVASQLVGTKDWVVAAIIVEASQVLMRSHCLWAPRCGLGVNQGLFCGSIQSVRRGW